MHINLFQGNVGNHTYWYTREWTDVTLPAMSSDEVTQEMSYLIRGLEPATQYEAKVQARNNFGWNKMSEILVFTTRDAGWYKSLVHLNIGFYSVIYNAEVKKTIPANSIYL